MPDQSVKNIFEYSYILILNIFEYSYRVDFLTVPTQFQYQKENRQSANHSLSYNQDLLEQQLWLAD